MAEAGVGEPLDDPEGASRSVVLSSAFVFSMSRGGEVMQSTSSPMISEKLLGTVGFFTSPAFPGSFPEGAAAPAAGVGAAALVPAGVGPGVLVLSGRSNES